MMAEKSRRAILVCAMFVVRTIALSTPAPPAASASAVHVPGSHWFARTCNSVKWIARLRREPLKFISMCTILSHPCLLTGPSSLAVTVLS